LHESHRRLESRVRERTRELSDANARLEGQIAERERFEKALRDSEQRYALAVTGANDGIWDWKLPSDIHFSPRWKSMLGFNDDELSNDVNTWLGRIHPEDRRLMNSAIARIQSSQDDQLELEYRMRHRDGSWRWFRCRGAAVRDEQGMVIRIAGSQSDIHARKRAEAQLIHDAFHDAMTGLPNRALFLDRLDRAVQIAFRDNKLLAVLFLDLDRFKLINDSLGHALGDQLLVEVSKRVEACVRPGDTLARLGGDEFTVLLESIEDETMAEQTARRIQQALEQPFDVDGHTIYTSASVGIAFSNESEQEPGGLLRDADIAMYRAKAKGKARYEVFEKEVRTAILEGLYLETDLRQALDRQQLTLFYQPIVSVSTGRLRGFEALIRWLHPERGLVLPDEFIPTAEETGLIQSIGTWVMETACGQMQAWRQIGPDSGAVELSVNLSSRQFLQDDLLEVFSGIFSRLGVGESNLSLDLEITESVLMENAERSKEVLNRLKRLGVRLSVDDFGTGYSSLSYLHRFPVDSLKIDRSFVSRIDSDRESREIVQAIIALAHNLGLTVIAEGVERQAHFEVLQKMNCDFAQGFYFARPLPVDDAQALLASQPQWGKWTEDGRASS
jgi:diguanylate cyclase (GGDEF)-like protein/PAS domain S-box-containing protein